MTSASELQPVTYGVNSGSCARFVSIAAWSAGYADRSDQGATCFDDQSSGDDDRSGKVANARLHHARLADGDKTARAAAKSRRGPCLARGSSRRVRPGIAVAQHHLNHANQGETI